MGWSKFACEENDKTMDNEEQREPYEPPVVEDLPLHPEEQLLAGCKGPGHSGPNSPVGACITRGRPCVGFTRS